MKCLSLVETNMMVACRADCLFPFDLKIRKNTKKKNQNKNKDDDEIRSLFSNNDGMNTNEKKKNDA